MFEILRQKKIVGWRTTWTIYQYLVSQKAMYLNSMQVEVREQPAGGSFLYSPFANQGFNSESQAREQVPLPTEQSC